MIVNLRKKMFFWFPKRHNEIWVQIVIQYKLLVRLIYTPRHISTYTNLWFVRAPRIQMLLRAYV